MEAMQHDTIEKDRLNKSRFHSKFVELLEIELNVESSDKKIQSVRIAQENTDVFVLVEEVETVIHQLIYHSDRLPKQNISDYISEKVNHDYISLNKLFKRSKGITIKKYINKEKLELVKELLVYDELDLSTIASKLQYRNTTHLADEFINATGVSPAFYRLLRQTRYCQTESA